MNAARLVGPTPPERIPWPLLAGGVYQAILDAGALTAELPDEAEWHRLERLMARGGSRESHQTRYAATIASINTDRERNWINGGGE